MEVAELTFADTGVWLVHTAHSIHRIDLDSMTAQRMPGKDANPYKFEVEVLRLRSITNCIVGGPAYFTYEADDDSVDFRWAVTTPIVRIVREVAE
ncbi:hypothetical protein D7I47_02315 [Protaetiibacter intestinalis]|uniref:Uncharacterized protein n=2 Tax=Protaetiibacter intestinalis TaxID=2419774 RepID=A0A387B7M7_9MICO|nr:hypothetical protein D7I47_02315 [Protaetiibacter intestinalis]